MVECNSSTLAYLSRAMRAQFDAFDSAKQHKDEPPIANLGLMNMWVTNKNGRACVRACKESGDGAKSSKYFRLDEYDNSVHNAAATARCRQVGAEGDIEAQSSSEGAEAQEVEEEGAEVD